jgi:hypothetical protein
MHADALTDRSPDRSAVLHHMHSGAPWVTYALTSMAVGVTAAVGARAVDPDSAWYRGLVKPSWQPPPRAFGAIWTPLYTSIAWAGGHAVRRVGGRQRNALIASLAANLTLNAAWNWMFFGLRSRADPACCPYRSRGRGGADAVRAVVRVRHRPERRHRAP